MTELVAGVDPGLRACGLGLVDAQTEQLVLARLVKSPEREDDAADAWIAMALALQQAVAEACDELGAERQLGLLVVERMIIRPRFHKARGGEGDVAGVELPHNPKVMMNLSAVTGAIIATLPARRRVAVFTSQWKSGQKSQTVKGEHNRIVWDMLSTAEKMRATGVELATTGHNVLDGIAMAKWGARRYRLRLL